MNPAELERQEREEAEATRRGASRSRRRDEERLDRADEDRAVTEDHEFSDEEALAFLETQWLTTRLPDPPPKPGYHRIWLSKTNQYTPIAFFERLGYRPVPPADWPGHQGLTLNSGNVTDNLITVNEMVLYEITEGRYQLYMRHMHHRVPLREEDKLRSSLSDLRAKLGLNAGNLRYEDKDGANGFAELEGERPPARNPQFQ
jgi:hypothetical protein